jgi:hypothetical protein
MIATQSKAAEDKPFGSTFRQLSDEVLELTEEIEKVLEDEALSEDEREAKSQELFNQWIGSEADWQNKAQMVAIACKQLDKEGETLKSVIDDFKSRKARFEKRSERLRLYLMNEMIRLKRNSVKGTFATITISIPTLVEPTVPVEQLPPEYVRLKPPEAKKLELGRDLKIAKNKGESFPWAKYVEGEESISIRIK